jgi:NAD(P)-dependent dehydrogenase (short-subunit alcohol dehydrogenase family)
MPKENRSFAGRVAFVTGAANGIGRAAALAFQPLRRGFSYEETGRAVSG